MKYRKLTTKDKEDPTYSLKDDYIFGHGYPADFYEDKPEVVGQAALTRLRLFTNEWYMDESNGTPYNPQVLGRFTKLKYDAAIRDRINKTQGVIKIKKYESVFDRENRKLSIYAEILTDFSKEAYILNEELKLPLFGK